MTAPRSRLDTVTDWMYTGRYTGMYIDWEMEVEYEQRWVLYQLAYFSDWPSKTDYKKFLKNVTKRWHRLLLTKANNDAISGVPLQGVDVKQGHGRNKQRHCTGHTMRRCSWKKTTYRHQFSIHKIVRSRGLLMEEDRKVIVEEFASHVDDGGLEATGGSNPLARDTKWNAWDSFNSQVPTMPYSLNKRKRWMIADDLRNFACAEERHKEVDFKVVLVERELTTNAEDRPLLIPRPDCVRVCESKTDCPEVLPNQKYSLVTDLRLKSKGLCDVYYKPDAQVEEPFREEEDDIEIYYEICYPRSDEKTDWRRERHGMLLREERHDRRRHGMMLTAVDDRKPASKKKKVKHYSYWHGLSDPQLWAQEVQDRYTMYEEIEKETQQELLHDFYVKAELSAENDGHVARRSCPSLGDVITCVIERSQRNHKNRKRKRVSNEMDACSHCILNTNHASSSPVKMHGKKATIYEENEDYNSSLDDDSTEENTTADAEVSVPMETLVDNPKLSSSLKLATHTVTPCHLKNVFEGAYIESMSQPRRFAVDISQRFDGTTGGKVYVLFEVTDDNNERNSYDWNQGDYEWETLEKYRNVRTTLITNPHFVAVNESELVHNASEIVHIAEDVVDWLTGVVKEKTRNNKEEPTKKKSKHRRWGLVGTRVSMDTVTKASGWKLKVDTPEGVYQDITENESEVSNTNDLQQPDVTMEFHQFCGICYEMLSPTDGEVEGTALEACGHWFCDECWKQHLRSRVSQGDFKIICPAYDCKSAVDVVTKMSLMSISEFFRHLDHTRDAAINRRSEWQWCPNPKCGRMACVVSGTGSVAVSCVCGWLWCSLCMQDAHWPATCKQAVGYRELTKKMVSTRKVPSIDSVDVKRCPKCKYPIEKNGGCPSMMCRMCGQGFCWICLSDWDAHTYSGINLRCPKAFVAVQTVYLDQKKKKSAHYLSEVALRHRDLRTKSRMLQQEENAYKLTAKEFLKEPLPEQLTPAFRHLNPSNGLKRLPFTWVYSESVLITLLEKSSEMQKCVQFCFEAHFVLEFLAIYLSDKSVKKEHKRELNIITDRLEFITGRVDDLLTARSRFNKVRLLTQAGKTCIRQLAYKIKNTQTVAESK